MIFALFFRASFWHRFYVILLRFLYPSNRQNANNSYSKTMIFEVLEVLGNDLEALSEMEAAKRALERCLRVPFCRFGEIFEILRVPLGDHLGSKN